MLRLKYVRTHSTMRQKSKKCKIFIRNWGNQYYHSFWTYNWALCYNSIVLFYWISTMLYIFNKEKQKVFLLKRLTRTQNMTECVMTRHSEPMCEISYQILYNGHSPSVKQIPHKISSISLSRFALIYQSASINFDL